MEGETTFEKFIVKIDCDLEDLIPGYLENRRKDINKINNSLEAGDFETIRIVGHSMKGSGGGYGFDGITAIGAAVEQAAKDKDITGIRKHVEELMSYLKRVEITYE